MKQCKTPLVTTHYFILIFYPSGDKFLKISKDTFSLTDIQALSMLLIKGIRQLTI